LPVLMVDIFKIHSTCLNVPFRVLMFMVPYILVMYIFSAFCGLVVSMLASGTQDCGFEPSQSHRIFRAKNPQHAFLWRGSKAVCPMSQICDM
jgi:hypothetical protein